MGVRNSSTLKSRFVGEGRYSAHTYHLLIVDTNDSFVSPSSCFPILPRLISTRVFFRGRFVAEMGGHDGISWTGTAPPHYICE